MTDPKTEALLLRYLEADERARQKGITIEALHKLVLDLASDRMADRKAAMQDREAAAEDRRAVAALSDGHQRHGRRILAIERQLETVSAAPEVPDWRPDPREITGTYQLAEIRAAAVRAAQHDEMQEGRRWWREHVVLWVVAGVGALLLATVVGCASYIASHYDAAPVKRALPTL